MIFSSLIAIMMLVGVVDDSLYVSTPSDVTAEMLRMADVDSSDVLYDLGSGAGRIVVTAAKWHGCRAVGVELSEPLCVLAMRNVKNNSVENLVTIRRGDVLDADLSDATVVCVYLMPGLLERLKPKLSKLPPGTRIVANDKPIPGWRAEKTVTMYSTVTEREYTLYLYRIGKRPDRPACRGGT